MKPFSIFCYLVILSYFIGVSTIGFGIVKAEPNKLLPPVLIPTIYTVQNLTSITDNDFINIRKSLSVLSKNESFTYMDLIPQYFGQVQSVQEMIIMDRIARVSPSMGIFHKVMFRRFVSDTMKLDRRFHKKSGIADYVINCKRLENSKLNGSDLHAYDPNTRSVIIVTPVPADVFEQKFDEILDRINFNKNYTRNVQKIQSELFYHFDYIRINYFLAARKDRTNYWNQLQRYVSLYQMMYFYTETLPDKVHFNAYGGLVTIAEPSPGQDPSDPWELRTLVDDNTALMDVLFPLA